MMGAQMGKTAGLLNVMGQKLDDAPVPMLYVGPTKSIIDRVIEPQLTAMLRSAPSLWEKTDHSRKAQKLSKTVNGVSVRLAWAGSPTELASQPAHTVLLDEIDRMEPIPGEGDPVTLAEARTTNYAGGRVIITSTPTEGNVQPETNSVTGIEHWKVADPKDVPSPIWKLWQEGTRYEWAVPCPHCQTYFVPRFKLLKWPEKSTPRTASRAARMLCPGCGVLIEDSAKVAMNAAGFYLAPGQSVVDGAVVGAVPDVETASFWVSGLMSPWRTWGQRAADWLRAYNSGDQEAIRAVINVGFGEPYMFKGEAPPAESVRECIGPYKMGTVPEGARLLTCGVDTQKRRLVYSVRAWGYSMESWLIETGEIWGETDQPPVWTQLAELLEQTWGATEARPQGFRIKRMGIDSGYRPGDKWRRPDNVIYEFCRQWRARVVPTKGRDRLMKPLQPSLIDITIRGQVFKQGLMLWHLDTDYWKSWVQAHLTWPPEQPGRWWVPEDVTDDYCLQVTAEARVMKPSGQAVWVRVRGENHFLDCEVINVAMAQSLGVHRRRKGKPATDGPKKDMPPPWSPPRGGPPTMPAPGRPPTIRQPAPPKRGWVNRF
jgi:phage terminase large subunit GpA-like protein